jgi:ribonuclease D
VVGLDTEFIRQKTYYPILCLVQGIFVRPDGIEEIFVVDVLEKDINLEPLIDILKNGNIKKIIHSFSQDLDALQFFLGPGKINNIEDTQVMAEFCGLEYSIGYLGAVGVITGENLTKNKSLQTSNWRRRPLTKKQLAYACDDVKYLLRLYDELHRKVCECGNYEFYRNEIEHLQRHGEKEQMVVGSWKRLKLKIHKKTMGRALLIKALASWRETRAIESNRIRNLVLKDSALLVIARVRPETPEDMKKLYQTNSEVLNMKKIHRVEILELVKQFVANCRCGDEPYYTVEMGFEYREELDCLYSEIATTARSRHICPDRVINKTDLIALLMGYEDRKNILYGWKSELLAELRIEQPMLQKNH